jgi:hypothetical protein
MLAKAIFSDTAKERFLMKVAWPDFSFISRTVLSDFACTRRGHIMV